MLFAPPTVYYCPACNKPMVKTNYMSYSVNKSSTWSDGVRTGYPGFTPNLAKCPNCAAVFFLHNIWAKKDNVDFEDTRYFKNIAEPKLADYIKAVQQGLAKEKYEEIELRTVLWRALNNKVRHRAQTGFSDDEMKIWRESCEKLLAIKEQERDGKKETLDRSIKGKHDPMQWHYMMGEISDLSFEIAELKRNLGRFDECLEEIEKFPKTHDWLKRQFEIKCKAKDPFVFKLRYQNKNPDGEDSFVDEDGAERHFLDPNAKNADLDKIIGHWTKEIERGGEGKDIYLQRRAYAYYKKGDYQSALTDINNAIETNGDDEDSFRIRAQIYHELGNNDLEEWNLFRARHIETFDEETQSPVGREKLYKKMNDELDFYPLEGKDKKDKPFILTEDYWEMLQNKDGDFAFCVHGRDGEPLEPEILYSGGINALLRRRPDQFILIEGVDKETRESLYKVEDVHIVELVPQELEKTKDNDDVSVMSIIKSNPEFVVREYTIKLRPVFENLDSVKSIVNSSYPLFTSLRAKVYANADKPIAELIGKEDYLNLAAVLAREEDYELLDKYCAEGLPVNGTTSYLFKTYSIDKPTPLSYITSEHVDTILKEPVKMINYLKEHGAIDNEQGDKENDEWY